MQTSCRASSAAGVKHWCWLTSGEITPSTLPEIRNVAWPARLLQLLHCTLPRKASVAGVKRVVLAHPLLSHHIFPWFRKFFRKQRYTSLVQFNIAWPDLLGCALVLLYIFFPCSSCPLVLDIIQKSMANSSVEGCPLCNLKERCIIPVTDVEMLSMQGSNPGRGRAAAFPPQCKGTAPSCGHLPHLLPRHSGSSGN